MKLKIYTDGGSLNNPGQAAYGFLVYADGKLLHRQNKKIGIASNNVAEYTALIRALEYVRDHMKESLDFAQDGIQSVQVISDSQLMVNQINGIYKVKNKGMKPLHAQIKMLEMELGIPISYKHVLRDKNKEADALVKAALGK